MPHAKQASKRRHRSKAAPVLGAAGLSLSIAGGASATTGGAAVQMPTPQNLVPSHHIMLGEEEMSDVSLGTFYVFDKEHGGTLDPNIQLAAGGCGCGHGGGGCATVVAVAAMVAAAADTVAADLAAATAAEAAASDAAVAVAASAAAAAVGGGDGVGAVAACRGAAAPCAEGRAAPPMRTAAPRRVGLGRPRCRPRALGVRAAPRRCVRSPGAIRGRRPDRDTPACALDDGA